MPETRIMGILNVTPDSFYGGGEYNAEEDAVRRAEEMMEKGADIIDVGGESTRPGAEPVPVRDELERVIPVIERIESLDAEISVDTRKPRVAKEALEAGAGIINDVTGLQKKEMKQLVAEKGCKAVIMDSVNIPVDRSSYGYENPVEEIKARLSEKIEAAEKSEIDRDRLIVDPGIGFGTEPDQDAEIIARIDEFKSFECPVLLGCSRKSFFGGLLEYEVEERLEPSLAANIIGAVKGADLLRVHDVEETVKAVEAAEKILDHGE